MESEFQDICASVQSVHNQPDGRAVHGHIGQIGGHQKPSAEKCGVLSETHLGECKFTAGLWIFGHHVGVGKSNDNHHRCAENHGNCGAGHAGIGKELFSRVNE